MIVYVLFVSYSIDEPYEIHGIYDSKLSAELDAKIKEEQLPYFDYKLEEYAVKAY